MRISDWSSYVCSSDLLQASGRSFESQTDTEVAAHLISREIEAGATPEQAVSRSLKRLRGAFALAILFRQHPDLLIGARLGSPLVIGYGDGETYLGSDRKSTRLNSRH